MDAVLITQIKCAVLEALQEARSDDKELMSVSTFAKAIDAGRTFVYAEIKAGRLEAVRVGDTIKIPRAARQKYLAGLPKAA